MHYDDMSLDQLVSRLSLQRHDEGGWFRRVYESSKTIQCDDREGGSRPVMTAIHYVLGGDYPVSLLHCNRSDIVHFHEAGCSMRYVLLHPTGELEEHILGPMGDPELVVSGGVFKGSEVIGGGWGMIGEAVSPGFDYRDRTLASKTDIATKYPQHIATLSKFLR